MEKEVISKRFVLTREDMKSWLNTALLFLAPVLLIYITYVLQNMADGFTWSDFVPNMIVQGSMVAYVLNELLALIRKFLGENKYIVK